MTPANRADHARENVSSADDARRSDAKLLLARLLDGSLHDPFAVLAPRRQGHMVQLRAWLPMAITAELFCPGNGTRHGDGWLRARRIDDAGLFEAIVPQRDAPAHPRWRWWQADSSQGSAIDPYSFGLPVSDFDRHLFNEGRHRTPWELLGAQPMHIDDVPGTRFTLWAPNAERVSVVGHFNAWDGRRHLLQAQGSSGLWRLFVPEVQPGDLYRFEVRTRNGTLLEKSDPYARAFETRPANASMVAANSDYVWHDEAWCSERTHRQHRDAPLSVYEVHLPSWRRRADGSFMNYREIAPLLAEHVQGAGFTHVEFLPLTEHPFDGSWGYQSLGFYAPTSRCGNADDLRALIDLLHARGIGVLLDWVPGHFPKDAHGLARFDGTALYEHGDPRLGEHPDWQTLVFDHGRPEVRAFLIGSALYWLQEFHFDGLRVDAVASMIYRDYSREPGHWLPNAYGGRENLEAIDFLRELNDAVHDTVPGALMIAEESTAWPGVTRATSEGGLGFDMKWNMGWMHDTLQYLAIDPVHRPWHHDKLTFTALYAHSEHFMLALSHDEVVHGKRALLRKAHGDDWQQRAQLRLLYTLQWTFPGKKLLFMGGELGQQDEWNHEASLPLELLGRHEHRGIYDLLGDVNRMYRALSALHEDAPPDLGFRWSHCDDRQNSVLSLLRGRGAGQVLVVLNFTPLPRQRYLVGVPNGGVWQELLNSDAQRYGGSNVGNLGHVTARADSVAGWPYSLELTLPPLAALILTPWNGANVG